MGADVCMNVMLRISSSVDAISSLDYKGLIEILKHSVYCGSGSVVEVSKEEISFCGKRYIFQIGTLFDVCRDIEDVFFLRVNGLFLVRKEEYPQNGLKKIMI